VQIMSFCPSVCRMLCLLAPKSFVTLLWNSVCEFFTESC
jgi:hypothetical protein